MLASEFVTIVKAMGLCYEKLERGQTFQQLDYHFVGPAFKISLNDPEMCGVVHMHEITTGGSSSLESKLSEIKTMLTVEADFKNLPEKG